MGCSAAIRDFISDGAKRGAKEVVMCVPGCQEAVWHSVSRRGLLKGAAATGLSAAVFETAHAAPPRRFSAVVDLTHTMSPGFPTFFGVPGIEMEKKFDFK
ncbi:MAG: twin-arginine translocation signal domain-containing protein, partial [Alphaproteobacteria bacterium]